MSSTIIEVKNLSKRYRIGAREKGYKTFREAIINGITAPIRNFGRLRKLTRFDENSDDTIWALDDVSFNVKDCEVIGIIGRNGSGKSTLLKILSKITNPTSGEVKIFGRVSCLLEIGTGFHPELTGRENIYLNGAILGMRRKEINRKLDEIVDFAEIEKFIDTPAKRYSSGMYVRLAFAVAAHLDPDILLVDEVLAVGDVAFQKKCLGKMESAGKEGRTVVLVSHNMASIINTCQRAILIDSGHVVADGKAKEVIQQYLAIASSLSGEIVWPDIETAPGNDLVRLGAVRILQDGIGTPTGDMDISKEILIQIEYRVLQEGPRLCTALWLHDQMGVNVLASGNANYISLTKDPWYGKPHPRGLFQSVCRIPANFLNDGRYSITAIVAKVPNDDQIFEKNVVSFDVQDIGEMRKEHYVGVWLGVVRPKLTWKTEKISL